MAAIVVAEVVVEDEVVSTIIAVLTIYATTTKMEAVAEDTLMVVEVEAGTFPVAVATMAIRVATEGNKTIRHHHSRAPGLLHYQGRTLFHLHHRAGYLHRTQMVGKVVTGDTEARPYRRLLLSDPHGWVIRSSNSTADHLHAKHRIITLSGMRGSIDLLMRSLGGVEVEAGMGVLAVGTKTTTHTVTARLVMIGVEGEDAVDGEVIAAEAEAAFKTTDPRSTRTITVEGEVSKSILTIL